MSPRLKEFNNLYIKHSLHAHIYPSHGGKTPLLCAAEAGHDEIVAYLLKFRTVRTHLESESGTVQTVKVSYSVFLFVFSS